MYVCMYVNSQNRPENVLTRSLHTDELIWFSLATLPSKVRQGVWKKHNSLLIHWPPLSFPLTLFLSLSLWPLVISHCWSYNIIYHSFCTIVSSTVFAVKIKALTKRKLVQMLCHMIEYCALDAFVFRVNSKFVIILISVVKYILQFVIHNGLLFY